MKLLSILLCILISLANATGNVNVCCSENASISAEQKCANDSAYLNLNCPDGSLYLLDRTNPDDYFVINETNEHLFFENYDLDPTKYCINLMEFENQNYHEVALICLHEYHDESEESPSIFRIAIFATAEIISTVFLIAIILVYLILPEVRDLQGICILQFLINYTALHIITNTLHYYNSLSCVIKGYGFYFFSLCAFFWLCLSSFNVWRSLKTNTENLKIYIIYISLGYGFPGVLLLSMILIQILPGNHLKPDFKEMNCWFKDYASRWWYYYMPVVILLLLNAFFLTDTARRLQTYKLPINIHRMKAVMTRCCLYTKLYAIVGVIWILEILCTEVFPSVSLLIYAADVLNCFQGLFVFFTLIATRNKVLKLLAKKRPCNMNCFPTSWITLVDAENEEENRNRYHKISEAEFIDIPLKTINSN